MKEGYNERLRLEGGGGRCGGGPYNKGTTESS